MIKKLGIALADDADEWKLTVGFDTQYGIYISSLQNESKLK